jgi:hypothetical protein
MIMARKKAPNKAPQQKVGQLELIDVGPKNLKVIAPHARKYREIVKERLELQKVEADEKEIIRDLISKSGLKHLPNGHITFECEGLIIDVEPRDEVIHVNEKKEKKSKKAQL